MVKENKIQYSNFQEPFSTFPQGNSIQENPNQRKRLTTLFLTNANRSRFTCFLRRIYDQEKKRKKRIQKYRPPNLIQTTDNVLYSTKGIQHKTQIEMRTDSARNHRSNTNQEKETNFSPKFFERETNPEQCR